MNVNITECHPLRSVCVLLNAVSHHLSTREFISSTLTNELLPDNTRIIYKSAASDKTREDALPIVAYRIGNIELKPYYAAYGIADMDEATSAEMGGVIEFSVSTTNEALTSELAFEIGSFCMSIHKEMQKYDMHILGATISGTQRGKAGYFDADVRLTANLGKPTWNHESNSSILREIGMKISIK